MSSRLLQIFMEEKNEEKGVGNGSHLAKFTLLYSPPLS